MKRRNVVLLGILIVVVIGVTLALSFAQSSGAGACKNASPKAYTITIHNSRASSTNTHGKVCDTLTFKNLDHITREIAFGPHEHHVPYDGVAERILNQNESFTITFNKAGTYHWHDHLHDEIKGTFVVAQ